MRHVMRVLLSACAFVALLSGCGQKDQGSQVTIGLPSSFPSKAAARSYAGKGNAALLASDDSVGSRSVSASATAQPRLISVNISYAGAPVVPPFVWKAASDTDTPPFAITIDKIPAGAGRLIQVLVAVEDSATKGITFYYGDTPKDFTGGEVSADIAVVDIGGAQSSDVDISGRYLRADGSGPTGLMNVTFLPTEGKPEMFLFQEEIFAGWFDVFALESAKFRYTMENGEEIFPFTTGLSNGFYLADQPYRNMRVKIPAAWRPNYQTADTTDRETLDAQRMVVGFFGPGAATANKAVCYSTTAEALTDVWQASTGSTAVSWAGATAPAAVDAGVEATGSANIQGGKALSSTMCTGDNSRQLYKDYLVFAHQEIRNRDKLLGFQGPFALKAEATRSFATTSWAADKVTVQWKYLPGIKETSAIEGVTVYSRIGYANNNSNEFRDRQNDGLACDKLQNLTGIRNDGDIPVSTETVDIANVDSANWTAQKVQIALCPYRTAADNTRIYLKKGLYVYLYGSSSGSVATGPAERIGVYSRSATTTTAASRETVYYNTCVPVRFTGETSAGLSANFPTGTQITLSSSDTNGRFYNDEQCATPSGGLATMSLSAAQSNEVYYKTTTTGVSNFSINASSSSAAVTAGALFASLPGVSPAADKVIVAAQSQGYGQSCFPVTFQTLKSSTGAFANVSADASWTLAASGMQFFYPYDYNCTGGSNETFTISFSPGRTSYRFNAKYTGTTAGTVTLTPVASSGASGFAVEGKSIAFSIPGAASRLSLTMPTEVKAEECSEVMVRLTDSNYHEVPNTGNSMIMASLTATAGGSFYTSHTSCTANSAPISSVSIYSGYSSSKVYYRNNTQGAATVSVTDGVAPTTYQGMTLNVTVTPPAINRIAIGLPGQTWDTATRGFTGIPQTFKVNEPFAVSLRAVTSSGNAITNASLTAADINLHDGNGLMTMLTTPTWSAGIATVSVKFNAAFNSATIMTGGSPTPLISQSSFVFSVLPIPAVISMLTTTFNPGNCQAAMVSIQGNADNTSALLQGMTPISFASSGGAMNFYSDAACTSDITSSGSTMTINTSAQVVFVNVTSGTPIFRATAAGLSDLGFGNVTAGSAGNIQNLQIVGNPNFRPNACQAFMVMTTDANGNSKTPSGAMVVQLAKSGNGLFYSTPDCSDTGLNTYQVPIGTSGPNLKATLFYFRTPDTSTQSISATDISGTPYCYSSSYCAAASMTINPSFGP